MWMHKLALPRVTATSCAAGWSVVVETFQDRSIPTPPGGGGGRGNQQNLEKQRVCDLLGYTHSYSSQPM